MTDEELGNQIKANYNGSCHNGSQIHADPWLLGAAARTILAAERPAVTREAVEEWANKSPEAQAVWKDSQPPLVIDAYLAALSHFVTPREARPIDGMSVEEIATELRLYCSEGPGYMTHIPISRAAERIYRLAQPAPKVDPTIEAEAEKWANLSADLHNRGANTLSQTVPRWDQMKEEARNEFRRAVAAAKGESQ